MDVALSSKVSCFFCRGFLASVAVRVKRSGQQVIAYAYLHARGCAFAAAAWFALA